MRRSPRELAESDGPRLAARGLGRRDVRRAGIAVVGLRAPRRITCRRSSGDLSARAELRDLRCRRVDASGRVPPPAARAISRRSPHSRRGIAWRRTAIPQAQLFGPPDLPRAAAGPRGAR